MVGFKKVLFRAQPHRPLPIPYKFANERNKNATQSKIHPFTESLTQCSPKPSFSQYFHIGSQYCSNVTTTAAIMVLQLPPASSIWLPIHPLRIISSFRFRVACMHSDSHLTHLNPFLIDVAETFKSWSFFWREERRAMVRSTIKIRWYCRSLVGKGKVSLWVMVLHYHVVDQVKEMTWVGRTSLLWHTWEEPGKDNVLLFLFPRFFFFFLWDLKCNFFAKWIG